jgi:hypothetical protein
MNLDYVARVENVITLGEGSNSALAVGSRGSEQRLPFHPT